MFYGDCRSHCEVKVGRGWCFKMTMCLLLLSSVSDHDLNYVIDGLLLKCALGCVQQKIMLVERINYKYILRQRANTSFNA